ncbi:MAG: hypothetical protein ABII90_06520 [Bacteroidota bacterium]
MPLSFKSKSHGSIAFGFFNIDSDMLLLEHYFFFASDFCKYISDIVKSKNKNVYESNWNVWYITERKDIGDLMGAIHGVRHIGFIGELYRRFPFPANSVDFKQKPEGYKSQKIVKEMIQQYATSIEIQFRYIKGQEIQIGDYKFDKVSFFELIKYVWKGGYPLWRDEQRPDYVIALRNKIVKGNNIFFENILLS